jgi:hypothetical protein
MAEERKHQDETLPEDELEETDGEPLPDREAMSIVEPFGGTYTLPVEPPE